MTKIIVNENIPTATREQANYAGKHLSKMWLVDSKSVQRKETRAYDKEKQLFLTEINNAGFTADDEDDDNNGRKN